MSPECSSASSPPKRARKTRDELRRQADLRHEQQRLTVRRELVRDQAQVDLGLAAAGHAVQQIGAKAGRALRANRGDGRELIGRELRQRTVARSAGRASGVRSVAPESTATRARGRGSHGSIQPRSASRSSTSR